MSKRTMVNENGKLPGQQPSHAPVAPPPREAAAITPPPSAPSRSFASILRASWKLIALVTLIATAIAWVLAATQPARYRASALAAIAPLPEGLEPNELLRGVEVLERRTIVATVAALAATPATRAQVSAAGGYTIEAAVLPNTNLFRVDVEGANAQQAAAIANRVPDALGQQTRAMFKYYSVTRVSPASAPDAPFLPRPGRAIAAGLLIGLFLGILGAYVRSARAPRYGSAP